MRVASAGWSSGRALKRRNLNRVQRGGTMAEEAIIEQPSEYTLLRDHCQIGSAGGSSGEAVGGGSPTVTPLHGLAAPRWMEEPWSFTVRRLSIIRIVLAKRSQTTTIRRHLHPLRDSHFECLCTRAFYRPARVLVYTLKTMPRPDEPWTSPSLYAATVSLIPCAYEVGSTSKVFTNFVESKMYSPSFW